MKLLNLQSFNPDLTALLLRLIFGGLLMYHGYTKMASFDEILPHFSDPIGIGSKMSFILVIFAEFFCGLLVLLGVLTRLSVIPILISMAVAYFIAHANDPFQKKELAFVFLLLSVAIFVTGSGKYSLDKLFFNKRSGRRR